jgi:hypothetical protein
VRDIEADQIVAEQEFRAAGKLVEAAKRPAGPMKPFGVSVIYEDSDSMTQVGARWLVRL